MPSASRESRLSDANGTGWVSHGVGSSVGAREGADVGAGWRRRPPREPPPPDERRRRVGCRRSVVLGFNLAFWLARAEGDDAADRVVRRNADGYAIARNHLDPEAAHAAAELGQYFVAGITLHTVETAAVDRHDCALHINEVVLAQLLAVSFLVDKHCATH